MGQPEETNPKQAGRGKRARIIKRALIIAALLLILIMAAVFILYLHVQSAGASFIRPDIQSIEPCDAAVILGAHVYSDGTLSSVLMDRVLTAIEVYKAKKARKILVSGDHGRKNYDEVNAVKTVLVNSGIPEEDIFLDHAGFDTFDSLYRCKHIFSANKVIIVTQEFHLGRALYIGSRLGLDVQGIKADRQEYAGSMMKLREIPACVKAYFEILFGSGPKFMGEKIPITGDGRKTWD
jgi:vancomycin permeability regulator SanA